ncbi:MAG: PTS sugar transporter subunit IIA [Halioglobus sp.]|nr:PTS sugar transporter subunit IIA [Halioglobus sp.]
MHALNSILSPGRTVCHVTTASKKRLFETIADIVSNDRPELPYADVLDKLVARENLGSTGLGQGIALPHCRVSDCETPIGTLISLTEAIPFDAPDEKPVDLLFVLLVPEEAAQEHLDILASIAGLFSQPAFCTALRQADNDAALYTAATASRD